MSSALPAPADAIIAPPPKPPMSSAADSGIPSQSPQRGKVRQNCGKRPHLHPIGLGLFHPIRVGLWALGAALALRAWPHDRVLALGVYPFALAALERNWSREQLSTKQAPRRGAHWGVIGGGIFGGAAPAVRMLHARCAPRCTKA